MFRRPTKQPREAKPFTRKAKKRKSKRRWKWILLLLVVLLLIPAMQVAVVRFINPPLTLPMLIRSEQRDVLKSAKASAPLPLDRFAANS